MAGIPIRTLRVPVAEVVGPGSKAGFYSDLRKSVDVSTAAANYCMSRLFATDTHGVKFRASSEDNLPPPPKLNLYQEIAGQFPLACNAAASMTRELAAKYNRMRWDIILGKVALPSFRRFPFMLPASGLQLEDTGEALQLSLQLIGGRWLVVPRQGSNYRWAISLLRKCLDPESGCELRGSEIALQRKSGVDIATLFLAVAIPPRDRDLRGVLNVSSTRDCLLAISLPHQNKPWQVTGDYLIQKKEEAKRRRKRIWRDCKAGMSRKIAEDRSNRLSRKMANVTRNECHKAASLVIRKALRSKCKGIRLDTTIRSYYREFPWHELETLIAQKARREGLEFCKVDLPLKAPEIEGCPLVYFAMELADDGRPTGFCKIGKSTNWLQREKQLTAGVSLQFVLLAADCRAKSSLSKREKYWHALFQDHRLESKEETFRLNPVLNYLREVDCLGNAGNLSQISQHIDV